MSCCPYKLASWGAAAVQRVKKGLPVVFLKLQDETSLTERKAEGRNNGSPSRGNTEEESKGGRLGKCPTEIFQFKEGFWLQICYKSSGFGNHEHILQLNYSWAADNQESDWGPGWLRE